MIQEAATLWSGEICRLFLINDPSLRQKVEKAVAKVKSQMLEIDCKTEQDMQREAAALA